MTDNNLITSIAGIKFLHHWEGTKKNKEGIHIPYLDTANKLTIGHGHLLTEKELDTGIITILGVPWKDGLDNRQAIELFRYDIRRFEVAMNELNDVLLFQNQFDALVSFSYNLGIAAYKNSTLRKVVNSVSTADEITTQFNRWVYSGKPPKRTQGLVNRRAAEALLYTTGKYN